MGMAHASSNRLLGLLALLFVFAAGQAGAQVETNYGSGEYGLYRQRLAGFVGRADALEEEVRHLTAKTTYCIGEVPTLEVDRAAARNLGPSSTSCGGNIPRFAAG